MKRFHVLRLACLGLVVLTSACAPKLSHIPGDYYVLSLVWRPTFCANAENAVLKECQPGATKTRLTLDGLSPYWDINGDNKRNDGDRYCTGGTNAQRTKLIAMDKAAGYQWGGLPKAPISRATRKALLPVMPRVLSSIDRHEWLKHGNCSGLAADEYYARAIRMTKNVQRSGFGQAIMANAGKTVDRTVLIQAFAKSYGEDRVSALTLKCKKGEDGTRSLYDVRIRVSRELSRQGVSPNSLHALEYDKPGNCGKEIVIPAR